MGAVRIDDGIAGGNGTQHRTLQSWEPATGDLLGQVPVASVEDVKKTIARARKAQGAWAVLPVEERCERLLRLGDAIVERVDEIVDVIVRECGKPRNDALNEVLLAVDQLTYYCKTVSYTHLTLPTN